MSVAMKRNRLHIMAFLQSKALEGVDSEKEILRLVSNEFADESPDGGVTHCGVTREQIKADAASMIKLVSEAMFPLERAMLKFDALEWALRGDVLQLLGTRDLSNPRDIRDAMNLARQLGAGPREESLEAAIEFLQKHGCDTAALELRFINIYPELHNAAE